MRELNELTGIIASGRSEYAYDTAGRILAAGYRKPQRITAVEELDALPEFTVILDADNATRERFNDDETGSALWVGRRGYELSYRVHLPATLLHVGTAE